MHMYALVHFIFRLNLSFKPYKMANVYVNHDVNTALPNRRSQRPNFNQVIRVPCLTEKE